VFVTGNHFTMSEIHTLGMPYAVFTFAKILQKNQQNCLRQYRVIQVLWLHLGRYETKGTKIPLVLRSPRWPRQIQTSTTTGAESFMFFPNVKAHLHFGENCARLVWFKEQKYFAFFKHTQFLPYCKHGL
jgi:hypothetical protein